jgi:hypothetical protein
MVRAWMLLTAVVLAAPTSHAIAAPQIAEGQDAAWSTTRILIQELSPRDPEKARRMLATLAEIGRASVEGSATRQHQLTALANEARAALSRTKASEEGWAIEPPGAAALLELPVEQLILKLPASERARYSERFVKIAADGPEVQSPELKEHRLFALRADVLVELALPAPTIPAGGAKGDCEVAEDGAVGFVTIGTKPESTIYFQGRELGQTPLSRVKLPAGCIKLEAVSGSLRRTVSIKIERNRLRIFQFPLEP